LILAARDELSWALGRFLRILLNDADAVVRETAVRGLWDDDDPALIGPLVQMLRDDPATAVRAAAATALGAYVLAGELEELEAAPAMRAEEALLAVLHEEREPLAVRRRALESVAYSSETGVHQLIEDAYYSPHEEMRISALFAMGRSADVRWRSLARAELRNPSATVRAEAALACGELEAKAALDDLLVLLGDRHAPVRMAAIFALGRIGGNDARDALETILLSDSAEEVEAAQEALEEMTFYADAEVGLFDESLDEDEEWENDRVDDWYDMDDRDLGEYEDDDDAYADDDDDDSDDDE
jgi:HEAT repeat protein